MFIELPTELSENTHMNLSEVCCYWGDNQITRVTFKGVPAIMKVKVHISRFKEHMRECRREV